jgi:hypothetical protein
MLICVAVEAEHVEDLRQDFGTTKNFITKLITSWPPTFGLTCSQNQLKLIWHDLDGRQRGPGFLPLWDQHRHELGATFSHRQRDCFESPRADQETVMSRLLRAGAIAAQTARPTYQCFARCILAQAAQQLPVWTRRNHSARRKAPQPPRNALRLAPKTRGYQIATITRNQ